MAGTQIKGLADAGAYPYVAGEPDDLVDLVLVRSISRSTVVTEYENKGDDHVSASGADLDGYDLTVTLAAYTPISVAALVGGTVTTGGVAPAAAIKHVRNKNDVVPYVKLAGQSRAKDADGGMARVTYPKCSWRGGPDFDQAIDNFAEISITMRAMADDDGNFDMYEIFAAYTALA